MTFDCMTRDAKNTAESFVVALRTKTDDDGKIIDDDWNVRSARKINKINRDEVGCEKY